VQFVYQKRAESHVSEIASFSHDVGNYIEKQIKREGRGIEHFCFASLDTVEVGGSIPPGPTMIYLLYYHLCYQSYE
jgi:hypothetical protein